jgi:REP element-mobilizing transposase RayT
MANIYWERYRRGPNRLPGFDYRTAASYFVTIRTQNATPALSTVRRGGLILNDPGRMLHDEWRALGKRFTGMNPDILVVMPDHVHGILVFTAVGDEPTPGPTLSRVIQTFKSLTTVRYCTGVRTLGWAPFEQRLWQRNFYDHVIGTGEFESVRRYIQQNPRRWDERRLDGQTGLRPGG